MWFIEVVDVAEIGRGRPLCGSSAQAGEGDLALRYSERAEREDVIAATRHLRARRSAATARDWPTGSSASGTSAVLAKPSAPGSYRRRRASALSFSSMNPFLVIVVSREDRDILGEHCPLGCRSNAYRASGNAHGLLFRRCCRCPPTGCRITTAGCRHPRGVSCMCPTSPDATGHFA